MNEIVLLSITAASLGFIHTALGPDHYLPFIVLSKARNWSGTKTMWITFISGLGHVGGSVVIGLIGIALGISLNKLTFVEEFRGDIVALLLIAFGLAYTAYGVYKFLKNGGHHHLPNYLIPKSLRQIKHQVNHGLEKKVDETKLTPWVLFIIFVFGPCEVLIPMLFIPAVQSSTIGIASVAVFFGITTIATMMLIVYLGHLGSSFLKFKSKEKYMHLLAGLVILIAGLGMHFGGW
ncbi:MAG TPA: sulfite exporter TauE/SafE family protein [Prolixibacteraceae bacterium]|jgi:sulfite exporter TauE/SafE